VDVFHDLSSSLLSENSHHVVNPVNNKKTYNLRRFIQTYNIRRFIQTYNLRRFLQTYNLRSFIQTYNLRRFIQTYNIRRFIQTYNLRRFLHFFLVLLYTSRFRLYLPQYENVLHENLSSQLAIKLVFFREQYDRRPISFIY
jgi:hypothetical protein